MPSACRDELRERASTAPGGATVPLDAASWRLLAELDAWMTPAARRCVAALGERRPAPPAVLERSDVHEDPTFVLAPGTTPRARGSSHGWPAS